MVSLSASEEISVSAFLIACTEGLRNLIGKVFTCAKKILVYGQGTEHWSSKDQGSVFRM